MAGSNEAWRRVNQQLNLTLPQGSNQGPWRSFASELFRQVEVWEEQERRNYKPKAWDFCVIHSSHPQDIERADAFKRLLETSLGLSGRTLGEVEFGERTLEAAEAMVEGSTKVFVLSTKFMNRIDVPKFIYQDVLMDELQKERWRAKMVPVVVQGNKKLPFGLRNIKSIELKDDPSTAEQVSKTIPVEAQMEVRETISKSKAMHHGRLVRLRSSRLQEIREVVQGMRERFGDNYDPTSQLEQMTETLRSMSVSDVPGLDQQVNISNCSNINLGPSFRINVSAPSTSTDRPSTSTNDRGNTTPDLEDPLFTEDDLTAYTTSTYVASITTSL